MYWVHCCFRRDNEEVAASRKHQQPHEGSETQQEPGAHGMRGCPAAWYCADGSGCDSVLVSAVFEFSGRFALLFSSSEFCGQNSY